MISAWLTHDSLERDLTSNIECWLYRMMPILDSKKTNIPFIFNNRWGVERGTKFIGTSVHLLLNPITLIKRAPHDKDKVLITKFLF